jgi:predicted  nucleic acid-binding Zn-ribbon protein
VDGACGNCFSVIPLQLQNEVRRGGAMVRCEACGVILTMPHQDQEA